MATKDQTKRRNLPRTESRIARDSVFFEKVVPAVLVAMAVLTGLLVLFAIGVLVGVVSF